MILECRLKGKVTIITRGASGIKKVIVRLFTKHDAKFIIVDFVDKVGRKLIGSLSPPTTYMHYDVRKEKDINDVVDLATKKHVELDIMYNNARIMEFIVVDVEKTWCCCG